MTRLMKNSCPSIWSSVLNSDSNFPKVSVPGGLNTTISPLSGEFTIYPNLLMMRYSPYPVLQTPSV